MPDSFPKLHSPFQRETRDGEYVVTPERNSGHEWVFEQADDILAAEKLHGTNVSVVIEDGKVDRAYTRIDDNKDRVKVDPNRKDHYRVFEGVMKAYHRGWLDDVGDGEHFGEVIGPKFHDNPYDLDHHLFVPFQYLREHCVYRSYGDHGVGFKDISEWFRDGLIPLFYARWHDVSYDRAQNEGFVEGVVFTDPQTGRMSKLRRDMFEWYEGARHKR